jgi:hypothetical protein
MPPGKPNKIVSAFQDKRIMPSNRFCLKALAFAALLAAGHATAQDDPWYSGLSSGFWGVGASVGFRSAVPGLFNPGSASAEGLSALKQFGGYRFTDAIAIEGAQTSFGPSGAACGGDPLTGDTYRSCYGSAWSLSGVATLPVRSGLSLHGRLGLHYWQKGIGDEMAGSTHRGTEDLGRVMGFGVSYELSRAVTFHADSERYSDMTGSGGTGPGAGLGLDSSVHSIGLSIKF